MINNSHDFDLLVDTRLWCVKENMPKDLKHTFSYMKKAVRFQFVMRNRSRSEYLEFTALGHDIPSTLMLASSKDATVGPDKCSSVYGVKVYSYEGLPYAIIDTNAKRAQIYYPADNQEMRKRLNWICAINGIRCFFYRAKGRHINMPTVFAIWTLDGDYLGEAVGKGDVVVAGDLKKG